MLHHVEAPRLGDVQVRHSLSVRLPPRQFKLFKNYPPGRVR
jgi:hypothetical protein